MKKQFKVVGLKVDKKLAHCVVEVDYVPSNCLDKILKRKVRTEIWHIAYPVFMSGNVHQKSQMFFTQSGENVPVSDKNIIHNLLDIYENDKNI